MHPPALVKLCHCPAYVTHQIHIIEVRVLQRNIAEERKKGGQTPLILHIVSKAGIRNDSPRTSAQHASKRMRYQDWAKLLLILAMQSTRIWAPRQKSIVFPQPRALMHNMTTTRKLQVKALKEY